MKAPFLLKATLLLCLLEALDAQFSCGINQFNLDRSCYAAADAGCSSCNRVTSQPQLIYNNYASGFVDLSPNTSCVAAPQWICPPEDNGFCCAVNESFSVNVQTRRLCSRNDSASGVIALSAKQLINWENNRSAVNVSGIFGYGTNLTLGMTWTSGTTWSILFLDRTQALVEIIADANQSAIFFRTGNLPAVVMDSFTFTFNQRYLFTVAITSWGYQVYINNYFVATAAHVNSPYRIDGLMFSPYDSQGCIDRVIYNRYQGLADLCNGVNTSGQVIRNVSVANQQLCCAECSLEVGCFGCNYDPTSGTCNLMQLSNGNTTQQSAVSSVLSTLTQAGCICQYYNASNNFTGCSKGYGLPDYSCAIDPTIPCVGRPATTVWDYCFTVNVTLITSPSWNSGTKDKMFITFYDEDMLPSKEYQILGLSSWTANRAEFIMHRPIDIKMMRIRAEGSDTWSIDEAQVQTSDGKWIPFYPTDGMINPQATNSTSGYITSVYYSSLASRAPDMSNIDCESFTSMKCGMSNMIDDTAPVGALWYRVYNATLGQYVLVAQALGNVSSSNITP